MTHDDFLAFLIGTPAILTFLFFLTAEKEDRQSISMFFYKFFNKTKKFTLDWNRTYDKERSSDVKYTISTIKDWIITLTGHDRDWRCSLCYGDFVNQNNFEKWLTNDFINEMTYLLKHTHPKKLTHNHWMQPDPHKWYATLETSSKKYEFVITHKLNENDKYTWVLKFMGFSYIYNDIDVAKKDLPNRINEILNLLCSSKRIILLEKINE